MGLSGLWHRDLEGGGLYSASAAAFRASEAELGLWRFCYCSVEAANGDSLHSLTVRNVIIPIMLSIYSVVVLRQLSETRTTFSGISVQRMKQA